MANLMNQLLAALRQKRLGDKPLKEVASLLGVDSPHVLKLEKGHIKRPSAEILASIRKHYGLTDAEKALLQHVEQQLADGTVSLGSEVTVWSYFTWPKEDLPNISLRVLCASNLPAPITGIDLTKLTEGQEAVLFHRAIERGLERQTRVPAALLTALRLKPARVFVHRREDTPAPARDLADAICFSDLVLTRKCENIWLATADAAELSKFKDRMEDFRTYSLSGDDAVDYVQSLVGEVAHAKPSKK